MTGPNESVVAPFGPGVPTSGGEARRSKAEMERAIAGHRTDVYRFALKLVGRRADADDVTQTVLLEALRGIDRFQGASTLLTWMKGIAINVVRSTARRQRYHVPLEDELAGTIAGPANTESSAADRIELSRVEATLRAMPAEFREAIVAVCLDGMRYDEAAHALGVPIGTIRSRVARGRAILIARVRGEEGRRP